MKGRAFGGGLSRARWQQLGLWGLLVFSLGWGLWAVLVDRRLSGSDTTTFSALDLIQVDSLAGFWAWISQLNVKGPLPAILSWPLLWLSGDAPLGTRLVSVLCHVLLIWQVHDLARLLGGSRRAGLWAALICATSPMLYGWGRLDFQEAPLAVIVVGVLQLMLRCDLSRARQAVGLGLLLGLGLLTKLSLVAYMVAPGIWLLARRVRGPRSAARVLLALAVMLLVAAPWALGARQVIVENFLASTSFQKISAGERLWRYLDLPGVVPLLAGALAGLVLLWGLRGRLRWGLALVSGFLLVSVGLFFFLFDPWSRYIVPLLAVAAAVAGAGAALLLEQVPGRARGALAGAGVAALLGLFVWHNLAGVGDAEDREQGCGLVSPDRRPHDAAPRALRASGDPNPAVLVAYDSQWAVSRSECWDKIWRFRGLAFHPLDLSEVRREQAAGQRTLVLVVRIHPRDPLGPRMEPSRWPPPPPGDRLMAGEREHLDWLVNQPGRRRLAGFADPDELVYELWGVRGRSH